MNYFRPIEEIQVRIKLGNLYSFSTYLIWAKINSWRGACPSRNKPKLEVRYTLFDRMILDRAKNRSVLKLIDIVILAECKIRMDSLDCNLSENSECSAGFLNEKHYQQQWT